MPPLDAFRTAAGLHPAATLKYEQSANGNGVVDRQTAAPKSFFGRAVGILRENVHLGPANSGTMARFKSALAQEHGGGAARMMEQAARAAKKELAALDRDYNQHGWSIPPGRPNALKNDVVIETRRRLTLLVQAGDLGKTDKLTSQTVKNADRLTGILAAHRHDPMLKMMGPAKFLGYYLAVEARISVGSDDVKAAAAKMSVPEKVALYGYTCADYKIINPALRGPQPIADPGVKAYCDHATAALGKAPLYTTADASGRVVTMRGINDPESQTGWAAKRYLNNSVVTESAFISTATDAPGKATYTATVIGNGGGRDVSGFSAWHAEKEILFPPGTQFYCEVDPADKNHFIMTEVAAPRLSAGATRAAVSQMVGLFVEPKLAADFSDRIKFDHLGRVTAENLGGPDLRLTQFELDKLQSAVVKGPTLTNAGGERMLRSEREVVIDFIGMLAKAKPGASAEGAAAIDLTAASMKALWLGGNLNAASAKAALAAARSDLAGVSPDLERAAARLGGEIDRQTGLSDAQKIALYQDNVLGRRFESEVVQALVKAPPASVLDAAGKVGTFVLNHMAEAHALAADQAASSQAPRLAGRLLDPDRTKTSLELLSVAIRDDTRPWHAETSEIQAFRDAVDGKKPLQAQVDAFAAMMSKTETGFDVMKQSFLAVKISTNLVRLDNPNVVPWMAPSTENYKAVVMPARSIVQAVGGTGDIKPDLFRAKGGTVAQTQSFGTTLPYQPSMRPDVGTPADWGSGRNIPATVHVPVTTAPGQKEATDFERHTLLNNQNNINGASGSTSIMTYLYQAMQAKGVPLAIDDAFAGTMMFLTFDGGHSLPESTGVFSAIRSTGQPVAGDAAGKAATFEDRREVLAGHVTSYDKLYDYFGSRDTRAAVAAAVETAFTRTQSFFEEVHSERLAAS